MKERMNDDQLLRVLARALELTEPIPEHVTAAAKEAILWRTVDAELAELVYDSAVEGHAGVRGVAAPRELTFRAPGVEIEVMVTTEGTRRLVGQLVPPQRATVELRFGGDVREAVTDRLGRFTFVDVPTGSIRLTVATEEGNRVATDWTVL